MKSRRFTVPEMCPVGFSVSHVDIDAESPLNQSESHIHKECEIYLNLSGDVSFEVENRIYPISRGSAIITRPYEYHHCIYRSNRRHEHYWITFSAEKNEDFMQMFFGREKGRDNLIRLDPAQLDELLAVLERLMNNESDPLQLRIDCLLLFRILHAGRRDGPVGYLEDLPRDVAEALKSYALQKNVTWKHCRATGLLIENGVLGGVKTEQGDIIADCVIVATGGLSYPATGSTGDGYAMAEALGHSITTLRPSLVPLEAGEDCEELQGLSLRNVTLTAHCGDKVIYKELGEMLFTHFGVSGPLVLSASVHMRGEGPYSLRIDLKPGLTPEKLDERLLRDFGENRNRCFRNALDALLPQKLIPVIIRRSGIDPDTRVNAITRAQRLALGELIKGFELQVYGFRPIAEAIVTAGGVDVSEVDPRTMESRLVSGLHFAGEILDIDAYTGGFNLQIAWCTGVCAGNAV